MGKAKRLGIGTRETGLALEYVRTRKVVRVLGWLHDEPIEPVEVPIDQLCPLLGIDPRDVGLPQHYLLFAGSHRRPGGGLRDLVGTFDSETKAWEAFRSLREGHPSVQGWAQLASVDGLGQINQLAWFGLHTAFDPSAEPPAGRAVPTADRTRPVRHRIAADPSSAYLRAVTPS